MIPLHIFRKYVFPGYGLQTVPCSQPILHFLAIPIRFAIFAR